MNLNKVVFVVVSLITVSLMAPIPQEEIEGDAATPVPTGWRATWKSVKSLLSKLSIMSGSNNDDSLLTRVGQLTMLYQLLTENPQELVRQLKDMALRAIVEGRLTSGQAQDLQTEFTNVGNQIKEASGGDFEIGTLLTTTVGYNGNNEEQGAESENQNLNFETTPSAPEPEPGANVDSENQDSNNYETTTNASEPESDVEHGSQDLDNFETTTNSPEPEPGSNVEEFENQDLNF